MLILSFEEFNNKFGIHNKAMSNIKIEDIGKDISPTPIEIVMKYQKADSVCDPRSGFGNPDVNIILNLHPTDGTHWILVIRRGEGGSVYYFVGFVVEAPPLVLEEYVKLGSNERLQQNDESYCGAFAYI